MPQSVDLTQIPVTSSQHAKNDAALPTTTVEYSSREVSPPVLLLQQLLRAHSIFLLHHGNNLSDLYVRLSRPKFCALLERFWNRFVADWNVLLHANPAVDVYSGLKLAAGGELGIGVGEEEWGSGEREVLEDFAGRTDGLVDIIVSRYGEPSEAQTGEPKKMASKKAKNDPDELMEPWMGAGRHAEAPDGVVFSGVGTVSRSSVRDISNWTQWIFAYGDYAYGVRDNPSSDRRKRKRKPPASTKPEKPANSTGKRDLKKEVRGVSRHDELSPASSTPKQPIDTPPGIPPPIVSAVERSLERATSAADIKQQTEAKQAEAEPSATDKWMKYLTLGYGSAWGATSTSKPSEDAKEPSPTHREPTPEAPLEEMRHVDPSPDIDHFAERLKAQISAEDTGHFVIGLKGSLEDDPLSDDDVNAPEDRILLRTLYVQLLPRSQRPKAIRTTSYEPSISEAEPPSGPEGLNDETDEDTPTLDPFRPKAKKAPDKVKTTRLRVVVYAHRPFIYTFLFAPRTASLSYSSFYRHLHTFFAPLHRPLSASTSPARVAARIAAAAAAAASFTSTTAEDGGRRAKADALGDKIFALVYDPVSLAVHASLPNIPVPGSLAAEGLGSAGAAAEGSAADGACVYPVGWTRAEALNVQSTVLEIVKGVRANGEEKERSVKTGRGWWVVWMRVAAVESRRGSGAAAVAQPCGVGGELALEEGKEEDASSTRALRELTPEEESETVYKEAILVRRARDAVSSSRPFGKRTGSGFFGFGGSSSGKDVGSGWGPARLAEGVGVDARRYVEGLLSLSR